MIQLRNENIENLSIRHKNYFMPIITDKIDALNSIYDFIQINNAIPNVVQVNDLLIRIGFGTNDTKQAFINSLTHLNNPNRDGLIKSFKRVIYILSNDLTAVLKGKPDKLEKLAKRIDLVIGDYFHNDNWHNDVKHFIKVMSRIFPYTAFRKKDQLWNAYKLSYNLKANVCPYCNRNYTLTVHENKIGVVRPEFDHFYCQKIYPYFSVSFFNLIPSCHTCNSLKSEINFRTKTHINPYSENFEESYKFTTGATLRKYLSDGYKISSGIEIVPESTASIEHRTKVNNNIKDFKLKQIYRYHKDIAQEIFMKINCYQKADIVSAANIFDGLIERDDMKESVYHFLFGNYYNRNNFINRPLSKFMKDISMEAGYENFYETIRTHLSTI